MLLTPMMKSNLKMMALLAALLVTASCAGLHRGKVSGEDTALPFSGHVVKGELDNGLTYYVRKNSSPENVVEFRLNVRTGSLNEREEERGIAHFVEHMAFNGTRSFKHNELIEFLEEAGLTFGQHTNAYTSTDVTNYQLSIPADRPDLLEKAFVILGEWADGITFDQGEIEKEKGVITEEWRMRKSATSRMSKKVRALLLEGARYPDRDPIGLMENVQGADRELLKGYYDAWYTPGNMSVIVVGDMDPAWAVAQIRKHMSGLAKRETPERAASGYTEKKGLAVHTVTDPEAQGMVVGYGFLSDDRVEDSLPKYKEGLMERAALSMFSRRISRMVQEEKAPFLRGMARKGTLIPGVREVKFMLKPMDGKMTEGLGAMFVEIERAARFGFTDVELEEVLISTRSVLENASRPGRRVESGRYAAQIAEYDLNGGHLMDHDQMLVLFDKIRPEITAEAVSRVFRQIVTGGSRALVFSLPESRKGEALSRQAVTKLFAEVAATELEPYHVAAAKDSLMDEPPRGGKVVARQQVEPIGSERVILSNGVTLLIRKSDSEPGMFLIRGAKPGGLSSVDDGAFRVASRSADIVDRSGFRGISPMELPRIMVGHQINISPEAGKYTFNYTGGGRTADMEMLFQMLHLYVTAPNVDDKALALYKKRLTHLIRSQEENRKFLFQARADRERFNDKYRDTPLEEHEVDLLTPEAVLDCFTRMFGDVNNFVFTIAGDVDVAATARLAARYLGGIAPVTEGASFVDRGVRMKPVAAEGDRCIEGFGEVEDRASVRLSYEKDAPFSMDDSEAVSLLRRIVSVRMREALREKSGGVYSVRTYLRLRHLPADLFSADVQFTCEPGRVDELTGMARGILAEVAREGVTADELDKAVKQTLTSIENAEEKDAYWLRNISSYTLFQWPYERLVSKREAVGAVSLDRVNTLASSLLSDLKGYVEVYGKGARS